MYKFELNRLYYCIFKTRPRGYHVLPITIERVGSIGEPEEIKQIYLNRKIRSRLWFYHKCSANFLIFNSREEAESCIPELIKKDIKDKEISIRDCLSNKSRLEKEIQQLSQLLNNK